MKKTFLWSIGLGLASVAGSSSAHAQLNLGPHNGAFGTNSYPVPSVANGYQQVSTQGYTTTAPAQSGYIGPQAGQIRMVSQSLPSGQAAAHQHIPAPIAPIPQGNMGVPHVPQHAAPLYQNAGPAPAVSGDCSTCNTGMVFAPASESYGQPIYQSYQPNSVYTPIVGGFNTGRVRQFGGNASHWFGGVNALVFKQVDGQKVRLTNDSTNPTDAALSTRDARPNTIGGVQFMIGKYFNCGKSALTASYWGLYPSEREVVITPGAGGNLRSELPFTDLGPGGAPATLHGITMPGQNVYDWYDGAAAHRLVRDQEFNNVEINLLGWGLGCAAVAPNAVGNCRECLGGPGAGLIPAQCSRLRLNWLAGIRWLRFNDYFEYATSETDTFFGTGADDFYYSNDVTNDLVGFQLGQFSTFCLTDRVNLIAGSRFGIYGNHMQYATRAGTAFQDATIVGAGSSYDGDPFNFRFSRTDVAFLGELDAGMAFRITRCWSANVGYRAIAASGIATAVGQIPQNFVNVNDIGHINNGDSLILHGAYFGATCNF